MSRHRAASCRSRSPSACRYGGPGRPRTPRPTMGLNTCCASHRRAAARGVGRVVPTLLTWLGSAIVSDIKRENWEITVGLRARIGRVLLFDPTKQNSAA
jgi:hypothetical protein